MRLRQSAVSARYITTERRDETTEITRDSVATGATAHRKRTEAVTSLRAVNVSRLLGVMPIRSLIIGDRLRAAFISASRHLVSEETKRDRRWERHDSEFVRSSRFRGDSAVKQVAMTLCNPF